MHIIKIHYIAKLKIIHLYNNTTILRFQVFLSFLYIEWEMLHSLAFVYLHCYFLNAELHFIQHFYFESIAVRQIGFSAKIRTRQYVWSFFGVTFTALLKQYALYSYICNAANFRNTLWLLQSRRKWQNRRFRCPSYRRQRRNFSNQTWLPLCSDNGR